MSAAYIWTIIIGLFLASYLIRFSFLGLLGRGAPSPTVERLLRYVPSAVLPALIAPMVFLDGQGGMAPAHSMIGAGVALAVGLATRHMLATLACAMAGWHLARLAGL